MITGKNDFEAKVIINTGKYEDTEKQQVGKEILPGKKETQYPIYHWALSPHIPKTIAKSTNTKLERKLYDAHKYDVSLGAG